MKRSIFLFWVGLAWGAEGPSFDCAKSATEVEYAICEDAELSGLDRLLAELYDDAKRTEDSKEVVATQKEFIEERDECYAANDPQRCVENSYRNRLEALDPATPEETIVEDEEGKRWQYQLHSDYTLADVTLQVDFEVYKDPLFAQLVQKYITTTSDSFSSMAAYGSNEMDEQTYIGLSASSGRLLSVYVSSAGYYGGAHPVWSQNGHIFDSVYGKEIEFWEIFNTSDLPRVQQLFNKAVLFQIKKLNDEDNPEGEIRYRDELEAEIENKRIHAWKDVTFLSENRKFIGVFVVNADAYEFGAYIYSDIFARMEIDATPFLPYIKPQYRDSFAN